MPAPGGARGPLNLAAPSNGAVASGARTIAILLPLTGANAEVGRAMLRAAQLALEQPGGPGLVQEDTHGTPEGAASAARNAVAAGAGLMLGPLTAGETSAAGPIARAAGIPMLAFTSDPAQAQPGVWPLGLTPGQQVRPLMRAMQAEGKPRIAAVLPQNLFGDAVASGLLTAASDAGLPEPRIIRAPYSFAGFNTAIKTVSDAATRRPGADARTGAAPAASPAAAAATATPSGPAEAASPPPPMDALFLGATGTLLGQAAPLLTFYGVGPAQVRVLGPATWLRDAAGQAKLAGAWFAAPDPAARAPFEALFTERYHAPARDLTSLAYDAASIARVVATPEGYPTAALTRADGFGGADGLVALLPDGQVRRGLAIFEVDQGGSHVVQPAPQTLTAPGA